MLNSKPVEWVKCGSDNLSAGHSLNKSEILFAKIEDEIIEKQLSKLPSVVDDKKEPEVYENEA